MRGDPRVGSGASAAAVRARIGRLSVLATRTDQI
jgi:hypothetical protein